MGIIICEYCFNQEDPDKPGYSLHEVDYYAWIPANPAVPNHRLSLRKNLKTNEYEVYQFIWLHPQKVFTPNLIIQTTGTQGAEEIIYTSKDLKEAMEFAYGRYVTHHGLREPDTLCEHKYPNRSSWCMKDE